MKHLRARAVEIGPHPGMLGLQHGSRIGPSRGDLAVGQRATRSQTVVSAGEIVGDHEHGEAKRPLQRPDQRVEFAGGDRIEAGGRLIQEQRAGDRARAHAPAPRA